MGILETFQNGKKVEQIVFPVTDAGRKSIIEVTIRNKHPSRYTKIDYVIVESKEVKVTDLPEGLEPGESSTIKLMWSPESNNMDPLKTTIRFKEVVG